MIESNKYIISVVIPVYNEQENLEILYDELKKNLSALADKYEVIFVDDGSTDGSQKILEKMKNREESRLKIIELRRNFGKAAAYKAGFNECRGELVITMDGDLQDDPGDIRKFISKLEEGNDIVIGWKHKRADRLTRVMASRFFNIILRRMTGLCLHDFDNGYRCMRREIIPYLDLYAGLYRYIPVFADFKGFNVDEVKVNHRKRKFGKSKYGFSRIFGGFFDLITVGFLFFYLKRPLHFFGGVGSLFFLAGFMVGLYLTYIKIILGQPIGGRPLLIFAVLLIIIGVQLVLFGLIGEMIANMSRRDKDYSIKKII